ncbi:MAG TPA: choice-of-anchor L domain-containing protein, partial [Chitinophagales bacterium]|nr:choice-of-anchor L domain-containing protein [Chitinophagales bacterium]
MQTNEKKNNLTAPRKITQTRRTVLRVFLFFLLAQVYLNGNAQLSVTQNANASSLAQLLTGNGVTITNVTKSCDNNGSGTFTSTNTNLGVQQGVVLATGKVQSIAQAASNFANTQFSATGDAQLSTLTTGTIYDPCTLEFDIVPQGSTLKFRYVFASEEYPEFVCSKYNDVFGFFISGANPSGGSYSNYNMATLPTSGLPVCINSVNPGTSGTYNGTTWNSSNCVALNNTSYYVDNLNPTNANIVYDGMTVVLTATASVVPCQTYHLKISIADVADRLYDSGVFLEAYSFTSTPYSTSVTAHVNNPAYTSTYEGCMGGYYTVSISAAQTSDVTLNLQISGTATNGVDYNTIASTVTIPAGQTSVNIPMTPVEDHIAEGAETATLSVVSVCSGAVMSSATLTINDDPSLHVFVGDSTICKGQSTQLTADTGIAFSWSPASGLSSSTIANPTATPTATTNYTVTATVGSCTATASQTIYVSNPAIALSVSPGDTVCTG